MNTLKSLVLGHLYWGRFRRRLASYRIKRTYIQSSAEEFLMVLRRHTDPIPLCGDGIMTLLSTIFSSLLDGTEKDNSESSPK